MLRHDAIIQAYGNIVNFHIKLHCSKAVTYNDVQR